MNQRTKEYSHLHNYKTQTSVNIDHSHRLGGTTSPEILYGDSHIHRVTGTTTVDAGHSHQYDTITGPAIPTGSRSHVHNYSGITSIEGKIPHNHEYSGTTGEAIYKNTSSKGGYLSPRYIPLILRLFLLAFSKKK